MSVFPHVNIHLLSIPAKALLVKPVIEWKSTTLTSWHSRTKSQLIRHTRWPTFIPNSFPCLWSETDQSSPSCFPRHRSREWTPSSDSELPSISEECVYSYVFFFFFPPGCCGELLVGRINGGWSMGGGVGSQAPFLLFFFSSFNLISELEIVLSQRRMEVDPVVVVDWPFCLRGLSSERWLQQVGLCYLCFLCFAVE